MDLLFIELILHLSHVKQMYSQPLHLAHELILCIEITQGQVDFNGDSAVNAILCARFLLSVQQEILMNLFSCSTCTGRQRP